MLSNVLLSSASKMVTPEANPALLAKAPGFRRGNQSLKTAQTVAPPSIALEIPYSASLVARRLDFGNGAEIGTSPAGVPGIGESGTNKLVNRGVIGSGIPSFGNIPKKRSYIEDDLKFSAAIGSTLNPNAPNFKSVMSHKNYDHSFSFPPLSQPFAPSVKSQTISNIAFDYLAGKAPPAFDGNPPSFMFDYGPANELWKFNSSESAAIQNGSSDFLNNSLKADSSQFHLRTPNDNYIHGSSFLNGDTCLPKEPRMFQESRYSPNENTFINSMFPSQLDMANSLVSQSLFSAFSSDTPYNQSTEDYFPSLGHPSSHSAGLYQPISSARSYLTNSSLGLPPHSPSTHEWQQLNSLSTDCNPSLN